MAKLRLSAQDTNDLEVMASHLQDMILRVGDMVYLPSTRRFVMVGTRFCWELVDTETRRPVKGKMFYRVQSGFHFDDVLSVRMHGFDQSDGEAFLVLLNVTFEPGEDGAGTVLLNLAGGAEIALSVECIEAAMSDVSPPWPTDQIPTHED